MQLQDMISSEVRASLEGVSLAADPLLDRNPLNLSKALFIQWLTGKAAQYRTIAAEKGMTAEQTKNFMGFLLDPWVALWKEEAKRINLEEVHAHNS